MRNPAQSCITMKLWIMELKKLLIRDKTDIICSYQ